MTEPALTSAAVERLYSERVLVNDTPEYLQRYEGYDFQTDYTEAELAQMEFPRLVIIREFARLTKKHGISARRVLMLNGGPGGDPELQQLPHDDVDFGDYEQDPDRYDMHDLRPPHDDYDFVLFSQTLEHLWDPLLAVRSVSAVMGDSGYVWTSVPTVNCQHNLPYNFISGFTPIGLASLFQQAGFDVVEVGQWGNRKYLAYVFELGGWPIYDDLQPGIGWAKRPLSETRRRISRLSPTNLRKDGTRNEFDTPVQTWVLGRKGAGQK